jgi:hypothetical protein
MRGACGGAPKGNKNALKPGDSTAESLAVKKQVHALARMAREMMTAIEWADGLPGTLPQPCRVTVAHTFRLLPLGLGDRRFKLGSLDLRLQSRVVLAARSSKT